jgi:MoxR-like ATPase
MEANTVTPTAMHPVVARVRAIEDDLNTYLIGRREEIRGAFLAMCAAQHVFYLGQPGSGKSFLVHEVARRIRGADESFFAIEFNAFILREEIFGPISLTAMREHDSLSRKYQGFLPSAVVAQLDELWKAPPSLLNTLLRILNEREFRNDTEMVRSPLVSAMATSNELPPTDRSLDALYDRILLRYETAPLVRTDDRRAATNQRLATRGFETEARMAALDLATVRARKLAAAEAGIKAASSTRLAEAGQRLRAQYKAQASAEETRIAALPEDKQDLARSQMHDAVRRGMQTDLAAAKSEEADRITNERAEMRALYAAEGIPASIVHPDSWVIDYLGEHFSDEARIKAMSTGTFEPELGVYDTPDVRELVRRLAHWCVKHNYVAPYHAFLGVRDLDTLHSLTLSVTLPDEVEKVFYRILDSLSKVRSVRRETDLRLIIAAQALLEGRASVSVEDLSVMRHVLWDRREDRAAVNEAVSKETIALDRELEALRATIVSWEHNAGADIDVDYDNFSVKKSQREHEINRYKTVLAAYPSNAELKRLLDRAQKLLNDYEIAVMGRLGADVDPFQS